MFAAVRLKVASGNATGAGICSAKNTLGRHWRPRLAVLPESAHTAFLVPLKELCFRRLKMQTRRAVIAVAAVLLAPFSHVEAQGNAKSTEASLREAIASYVATWNRHNVQAWSAFLADDIWYTEASDYYERMKGRKAVLAFFGDLVKTTDLKWDIKSVKMMPDGTATVVLGHFALILPKTGGKYASTFESTPSVSRWRIERERWRMFYFTSDKGSARVAMQKDGVS